MEKILEVMEHCFRRAFLLHLPYFCSHGLSYTVYCIFEDSHVHTSLWNLDNFLSSLMPHGFGIGRIGILLVSFYQELYGQVHKNASLRSMILLVWCRHGLSTFNFHVLLCSTPVISSSNKVQEYLMDGS